MVIVKYILWASFIRYNRLKTPDSSFFLFAHSSLLVGTELEPLRQCNTELISFIRIRTTTSWSPWTKASMPNHIGQSPSAWIIQQNKYFCFVYEICALEFLYEVPVRKTETRGITFTKKVSLFHNMSDRIRSVHGYHKPKRTSYVAAPWILRSVMHAPSVFRHRHITFILIMRDQYIFLRTKIHKSKKLTTFEISFDFNASAAEYYWYRFSVNSQIS